MRDLLRHRDFRLLLAGQTLSMFGDTAMLLVLAMWAKELTGSSSVAGTVFGAVVLPSLLAPFGGILIDRFRRRHVMIVVDVATAVAVLCLLFVHDRSDLWILYVVGFLYGASLIAFQSARSALLASTLPDDLLGPANGSLGTVREALRLVGPVTGAALFAGLGGPAVAVLDAGTFLVSALSLAAMRSREPAPAPREGHVLAEMTGGVRHLWKVPLLRSTVVATVACMLVLGFGETVVFAVVDEGLGKPVAFLGVLGAVQGVGAIAGGLVTTATIRRTGELRPIAVGLGLLAVGCLLAIAPDVWVVCLGWLVFGAGLPATIVGITTAIQRRTPMGLQGRVFTAFELLAGGPQLTSILVGAALVALVDYRLLLVAMATGIGLAALYAAVRLREPAGSPLADPPVLDDELPGHVDPLEQPPVVADEQQRAVVGP
jgi:MFS family permease